MPTTPIDKEKTSTSSVGGFPDSSGAKTIDKTEDDAKKSDTFLPQS